MDNRKYTNRPVDNMDMKKSKKYMWAYLSKKLDMQKRIASVDDDRGPVDSKASFADFFKSLFRMPERWASVSVIAGLLVIALVFSSTMPGWFGTKIQVVHADFEMMADSEDASGVDSKSGFTLTASEDVSVELVKENLKVEPEIKLNIEKTDKGKYKVKPAMGMEGNKIYNFTIKTDKGQESWAYQIQNTFKIDGTLPSKQATNVPTNTGIEINFSHSDFDFENAKDFFEISPKIKGNFKKYERILAFIPDQPLNPGNIYSIKIKKGFKLKNSEKTLSEDYIFQFETGDGVQYSNHFSFQKPYYEIASGSPVAMDMYAYNFEQAGKKDVDIQVFKYADLNQYLNELRNSMQIPQWAYYSRNSYSHSTDGLKEIGTFKGLIEKPSWNSYVYLPDQSFDEGYYLLEVNDSGVKAQTLLQITDLSAYTNISMSDSLVWVNDVKNGMPVSSAIVEVDGVEVAKSDKEGIAKFKTPEKWLKEGTDRGISTIIKIRSPDGKILITALDSSVYIPDKAERDYWKILFTDRPRYKPNDTVSFWGFIKPKKGASKPSDLKMQLSYNWETFAQDIPLEVESDGTYKGKFDLKNLAIGYYYLNLYEGDTKISSSGIEVENYNKPAFDLKIEADKEAVFSGEKLNFKVKSQFFDGTPVAKLELTDNGKILKYGESIKTNLKGEANLSYLAEANNCSDFQEYCSDENYFYYNLSAKFGESSAISAESHARIFTTNLKITSKGEARKKDDGSYVGNISVKTNFIDLTRLNSDKNASYDDYLGKAAGNRNFNGKITEVSWNKVEDGQYYNAITKLTEKVYKYVDVRKEVGMIYGVTDVNGEGSYEFKIDPDKYYIVVLQAADDKGAMAHGTVWLYGEMSRSSSYDYYNVKVLNKGPNDEQKYDIGDKIDLAVANGEVALSKDTKGNFLFMQQGDGIQQFAVKNSPYYSFNFAKENIPNVYVEAIWFDGRQYKEAYATNLAYNSDLKKLKIKISSDKEEYGPGDEVNLSVNVSDQSGRPVKSKVNFNVVDEAYYKAVYSYMVDPVDELYSHVNSGILTSYKSHVNPVFAAQGGEGKGGCFTGETQILMGDGSTKAIKDIQNGDMVLTKKSEFSPELISAEVKGKVTKRVGEYLLLNGELEVTAEHVMFVNGSWKRAGKIKIGDQLVNQDGRMLEVASISRIIRPVDVYNIEIKDYHTYFANGIFVHNDKGGDGYYVREEFKDTALFYTADTGVDGRGGVKFKVPDNITSWRILTRAVDFDGLQAGSEYKNIKVTLPFFMDVVANSEYSIKDNPLLKFRAYGKELKDGDDVVYRTSTDGSEAQESLKGKAFGGTYFKLPSLEIGSHDVTVKANSGGLKDAMKKTFEIKGSRLKQDVVKIVRNIDDKSTFELGKVGPTQIEFMDSGVAYYYYNLLEMAYDEGTRLDQVVARKAAKETLNRYFGKKFDSVETKDNFIVNSYQRESGLSLLPYSSQDLKLSALVMAFDKNHESYANEQIKNYFYKYFKDPKSNLDDILLSLLGLASMKEPVLLDLMVIEKAEGLSVQQKLYLGIAYAEIGSNDDALRILKVIVSKLANDKSESAIHNLALGAVLAASVNDFKLAEAFWKDVENIGFKQADLKNIYELGYVSESIENLKKVPVKFSYKLNKHEETLSLKEGEAKSIMALPGDVVEASVKDGSLAAVLNYEIAVEPEDFKKDARMEIGRKYFVNGKETNEFNENDLVKVVLNVNNPGKLELPFYRIRDILPSGLTPVTSYLPAGVNSYDPNIRYPFMINGQEIDFCWFPFQQKNEINDSSSSSIAYYAKVVNPGKFYADPARIESFYDKNSANISEAMTIKINPLGE